MAEAAAEKNMDTTQPKSRPKTSVVYISVCHSCSSGTEFITTFLTNYQKCKGKNQKLHVVLTALEADADVNIQVASLSFSKTLTVRAGKTKWLSLPKGAELKKQFINSGAAVRISSSAKITAVTFNRRAATGEGAAVSPLEHLGTNHILYVPSDKTIYDGLVAIVNGDSENEITIVPPRDVKLRGMITWNQGEEVRFTMKPFDTYLIKARSCMTGTQITSQKPVAVLTGHQCLKIGGKCDHVYEQLPPVFRMGKEYIIPSVGRPKAKTWGLIVASEDNTVLTLSNGCKEKNRPLQTAGQTLVVVVCHKRPLIVKSNKKVMVLLLSNNKPHDPFLIALTPTFQMSTDWAVETVGGLKNKLSIIAERKGAKSVKVCAGRKCRKRLNWKKLGSKWVWLNVGIGKKQKHVTVQGNALMAVYTYGGKRKLGYGTAGVCGASPPPPLPDDPCEEIQCGARERCVNGACVPTSTATCHAKGDPHYYTLDGRCYNFQGTCTYIMATVANPAPDLIPFTVLTKNAHRGNQRVSFVKTVTVIVYGQTIIISRQKGRVQVNGVMRCLPFNLLGGKIKLRQAGCYAVLTTDFGLIVKFDWNMRLIITVPSSYFEHMGGLCGNYNGDRKDDLPHPTSKSLPVVLEMIKHWKVDDPDLFCNDNCGGSCPECSIELQNHYRKLHLCGLISKPDGPFAACHSAVHLSAFVNDCVYDLCVYGGAKPVLCDNLKTYADSCLSEGVQLSAEWREVSGCIPDCPAGSHYEACGTACPAYCSTLDSETECNEPCVEGCQCDEGYVLSGEKCVPKSQCGCDYQDNYYPSGTTFWEDETCTSRCKCENGTVECETTSCANDEHCALREGIRDCYPASFGLCKCTGDPHCTGLDGRRFHFQGTCTYILSQLVMGPQQLLEPFQIQVTNENRGRNKRVSWTKSVFLTVFGGFTIGMSNTNNGKIMVNGRLTNLPYNTEDGNVRAFRKGRFGVVKTSFGLMVKFDWRANVQMSLPSTYTGQTNGLCGNFDGNTENDFLKPDGTLADNVNEFGGSWQVGGEAGCTNNPDPVCEPALMLVYEKKPYCGIISDKEGPFGQCHEKLDHRPFLDDCKFDMCAFKGLRFTLCESLTAFADACQVKGGKVESWRKNDFCPMPCPANSHYELSAPACQPTCSSLAPPEGCEEDSPMVESCVCDENFLLSTDKCVLVEECGCWKEGVYYENGESFIRGESCDEQCTCSEGQLTCNPFACSEHEKCVQKDGVPSCEPKSIATCSLTGVRTVKTFDGQNYPLFGNCPFTMSEVEEMDEGMPAYSVLVLQTDEAGAVSRDVEITVYDTKITFETGVQWKVKIDDVAVVLPWSLDNDKVLITQHCNFIVLETDFGLKVTYDTKGGVVLQIPSTYHNAPRGLCGNNNNDPSDDMENGDPLETANLWLVSIDDVQCEASCGAATCPGPDDGNVPNAETDCGIIKSPEGPFVECHTTVEPSPYFDACVSELATHNLDQQILCKHISIYVAACQLAGVALEPWRRPDFCPPTCSSGSHYELCASSSSSTCASLEEPFPSTVCQEGCQCDDELLSDGNQCVPMENCGCLVNGNYYQSGTSVLNEDCSESCTCEAGVFTCIDHSCQEEEECLIKEGIIGCYPIATCWAFGDPHFGKLDGGRFSFQGTCSYIFLTTTDLDPTLPEVTVTTKNELRGNSQGSYVRSVTVEMLGYRIDIPSGQDDIILVAQDDEEGMKEELPYFTEDGRLSITKSGIRGIIETDFGVEITFDWSTLLMVTLSSSYFGNTGGLCGNYNGNSTDDMTTPDGVLLTDVAAWAESWSVPDGDIFCYHQCEGDCPQCSQEDQKKYSGPKFCGFLSNPDGPFAVCHATVPVKDLQSDCLYDVCLNDGRQEVLCGALSSYMAECQKLEVDVGPWRELAGCPLECPDNSHYSTCGPACPATCGPQPEVCPHECVEGCFCDDGYVQSGEECVIREQGCGCEFEGHYRKPGEEFWGNVECTEKCVCDPATQSVTCEPAACQAGEVCRIENGVRDCHPVRFETCVTRGDPHHYGFDGRRVDFQGNCVYRLAGLCGPNPTGLKPFEITLENENRNGNKQVSYAKAVTLKVFGKEFTLTRDNPRKVLVDGLERSLPMSWENSLVQGQLQHRHAVIETHFVKVSFDFSSTVKVHLASSYNNAVCGLCGNMNGDPSDDMMLPNGEQAATANEFGVSQWVADVEGCSKECKDCPPDIPPGTEPPAYTKDCDIITAEDGPLAGCINLLKAEQYHEDCVYDMMLTNGSRDAACAIIRDYVEECLSKGGEVKPWRTKKFCPMKCPAGSEYSLQAPGCLITCSSLSPPALCQIPPSEGCVCEKGKLMGKKGCVKLAKCGCTMEGQYYEPNEGHYLNNTCKTFCKCYKGAMVCEYKPCKATEKCMVVKGVRGCYKKGDSNSNQSGGQSGNSDSNQSGGQSGNSDSNESGGQSGNSDSNESGGKSGNSDSNESGGQSGNSTSNSSGGQSGKSDSNQSGGQSGNSDSNQSGGKSGNSDSNQSGGQSGNSDSNESGGQSGNSDSNQSGGQSGGCTMEGQYYEPNEGHYLNNTCKTFCKCYKGAMVCEYKPCKATEKCMVVKGVRGCYKEGDSNSNQSGGQSGNSDSNQSGGKSGNSDSNESGGQSGNSTSNSSGGQSGNSDSNQSGGKSGNSDSNESGGQSGNSTSNSSGGQSGKSDSNQSGGQSGNSDSNQSGGQSGNSDSNQSGGKSGNSDSIESGEQSGNSTSNSSGGKSGNSDSNQSGGQSGNSDSNESGGQSGNSDSNQSGGQSGGCTMEGQYYEPNEGHYLNNTCKTFCKCYKGAMVCEYKPCKATEKCMVVKGVRGCYEEGDSNSNQSGGQSGNSDSNQSGGKSGNSDSNESGGQSGNSTSNSSGGQSGKSDSNQSGGQSGNSDSNQSGGQSGNSDSNQSGGKSGNSDSNESGGKSGNSTSNSSGGQSGKSDSNQSGGKSGDSDSNQSGGQSGKSDSNQSGGQSGNSDSNQSGGQSGNSDSNQSGGQSGNSDSNESGGQSGNSDSNESGGQSGGCTMEVTAISQEENLVIVIAMSQEDNLVTVPAIHQGDNLVKVTSNHSGGQSGKSDSNQSGGQSGNSDSNQSGGKSGNSDSNESGEQSGNSTSNSSGGKSGNSDSNQSGGQSGNSDSNESGGQSGNSDSNQSGGQSGGCTMEGQYYEPNEGHYLNNTCKTFCKCYKGAMVCEYKPCKATEKCMVVKGVRGCYKEGDSNSNQSGGQSGNSDSNQSGGQSGNSDSNESGGQSGNSTSNSSGGQSGKSDSNQSGGQSGNSDSNQSGGQSGNSDSNQSGGKSGNSDSNESGGKSGNSTSNSSGGQSGKSDSNQSGGQSGNSDSNQSGGKSGNSDSIESGEQSGNSTSNSSGGKSGNSDSNQSGGQSGNSDSNESGGQSGNSDSNQSGGQSGGCTMEGQYYEPNEGHYLNNTCKTFCKCYKGAMVCEYKPCKATEKCMVVKGVRGCYEEGDSNSNQSGGQSGNSDSNQSGGKSGNSDSNESGGQSGNSTSNSSGGQSGKSDSNQSGGQSGNSDSNQSGGQSGNSDSNQSGGQSGNSDSNESGGKSGNSTSNSSGGQSGKSDSNQSGGKSGNSDSNQSGGQSGNSDSNESGGQSGNSDSNQSGGQSGGCTMEGQYYEPYEGHYLNNTCKTFCKCYKGAMVCEYKPCKATEKCMVVKGVRGCYEEGDSNSNQSGGQSGNSDSNQSGGKSGNSDSNESGGQFGNSTSNSSGGQSGKSDSNQSGGQSGNSDSNQSGGQSGNSDSNQSGGKSGNSDSIESGGKSGNSTSNSSGGQSGNSDSNQSGGKSGDSDSNQSGGKSGNGDSNESGEQSGNSTSNSSGGKSGNSDSNQSGGQSGNSDSNESGGQSGNSDSNESGGQSGGCTMEGQYYEPNEGHYLNNTCKTFCKCYKGAMVCEYKPCKATEKCMVVKGVRGCYEEGDSNSNQSGGQSGNSDSNQSGGKSGNSDSNESGGQSGNSDSNQSGGKSGNSDSNQSGGKSGNSDSIESGEQSGNSTSNSSGGKSGNSDSNQSGGQSGNSDSNESGGQSGNSDSNQSGGQSGGCTMEGQYYEPIEGHYLNNTCKTFCKCYKGAMVCEYKPCKATEKCMVVKGVRGCYEEGDSNSNQSGGQSGNSDSNQSGGKSGNSDSNESGGQSGNSTSNSSGGQSGNSDSNQSGRKSGNSDSNESGGQSGNSTSNSSGGQSGKSDSNQSGGQSGNSDSNQSGGKSGNSDSNESGGKSGNSDSIESGEQSGNSTSNSSGGKSGNSDSNQSGGQSGNSDSNESGGQSGNSDSNQSGGQSGGCTMEGQYYEPNEGHYLNNTCKTFCKCYKGAMVCEYKPCKATEKCMVVKGVRGCYEEGDSNSNQSGGQSGNSDSNQSGGKSGNSDSNESGGQSGNSTSNSSGGQSGKSDSNQSGGQSGNSDSNQSGGQSGNSDSNQSGGKSGNSDSIESGGQSGNSTSNSSGGQSGKSDSNQSGGKSGNSDSNQSGGQSGNSDSNESGGQSGNSDSNQSGGQSGGCTMEGQYYEPNEGHYLNNTCKTFCKCYKGAMVCEYKPCKATEKCMVVKGVRGCYKEGDSNSNQSGGQSGNSDSNQSGGKSGNSDSNESGGQSGNSTSNSSGGQSGNSDSNQSGGKSGTVTAISQEDNLVIVTAISQEENLVIVIAMSQGDNLVIVTAISQEENLVIVIALSQEENLVTVPAIHQGDNLVKVTAISQEENLVIVTAISQEDNLVIVIAMSREDNQVIVTAMSQEGNLVAVQWKTFCKCYKGAMVCEYKPCKATEKCMVVKGVRGCYKEGDSNSNQSGGQSGNSDSNQSGGKSGNSDSNESGGQSGNSDSNQSGGKSGNSDSNESGGQSGNSTSNSSGGQSGNSDSNQSGGQSGNSDSNESGGQSGNSTSNSSGGQSGKSDSNQSGGQSGNSDSNQSGGQSGNSDSNQSGGKSGNSDSNESGGKSGNSTSNSSGGQSGKSDSNQSGGKSGNSDSNQSGGQSGNSDSNESGGQSGNSDSNQSGGQSGGCTMEGQYYEPNEGHYLNNTCKTFCKCYKGAMVCEYKPCKATEKCMVVKGVRGCYEEGDSNSNQSGGQSGNSDSNQSGGKSGNSDSNESGGQSGNSTSNSSGGQSGKSDSNQSGGQPGNSDSNQSGGQSGNSDSNQSGGKSGNSDSIESGGQSGNSTSNSSGGQSGNSDSNQSGGKSGNSDSIESGGQSGNSTSNSSGGQSGKSDSNQSGQSGESNSKEVGGQSGNSTSNMSGGGQDGMMKLMN
ncbi:IgGFc-binding protein-like [Xyrichtys novacula]|uniref:IgGFc-binding protein-like n=1 Tax=Xyrichtys novacula TaxID=13765 RepID=A0AAV1FLL4_XYRNO|nr:IgGFc-binding protein-like [Xyrichtys novacula]